ncbi:MAG: hypothetical protein DRP55_07535 [Spirochaetes bacterium]|nr:MAG: hypothetical protein DRP55_07535 [Spirochaetota bacterium]
MWHIKYYLKKESFPLIAGIFTTSRCNMKCTMCTIWRNKKKEDITFKELKEFVDTVTPGLCYLSFSGGEPLLLKDIFKMIKYASDKIPYIHLVTNGSLITKQVARKLSDNGLSEISISIDGEEKFHEYIRGIKGSYKKAINALELMLKYAPNVKIVLNTVLFPAYPEQVYNVLKIAEKYKVYMKVQAVNTHFSFKQMARGREKKTLTGRRKVEKDKIKNLIKTLKRSKFIVNSSYYLDNIINYFSGELRFKPSYPECILPYFFIELNGNGILSPCMYGTGWENGVNWRKTTMKEAINSKEFHQIQKRLKSCRKCDNTMYICYWEPLSTFPFKNFLKYTLFYF